MPVEPPEDAVVEGLKSQRAEAPPALVTLVPADPPPDGKQDQTTDMDAARRVEAPESAYEVQRRIKIVEGSMREVLENLKEITRPEALEEGRSSELEALARAYDDLARELSTLKSKLEKSGANIGLLQLQDLTTLMEDIQLDIDTETPEIMSLMSELRM